MLYNTLEIFVFYGHYCSLVIEGASVLRQSKRFESSLFVVSRVETRCFDLCACLRIYLCLGVCVCVYILVFVCLNVFM